jgi:hypothetical protein
METWNTNKESPAAGTGVTQMNCDDSSKLLASFKLLTLPASINKGSAEVFTYEEYKEPHGYSQADVEKQGKSYNTCRFGKMHAVHQMEIAPEQKFQGYRVLDANKVS